MLALCASHAIFGCSLERASFPAQVSYSFPAYILLGTYTRPHLKETRFFTANFLMNLWVLRCGHPFKRVRFVRYAVSSSTYFC